MHSKINPALILLAGVGLLYCNKPVPVQELAQARDEIAMAEEEHAPEYSASNFQGARDALLASHQKLGSEEYDNAKQKAIDSFNQARAARVEASPKYTEATRATAEKTIAQADQAYAEELAKDDFSAAKKLYGEGTTAQGQAKAATGDAQLDTYRQAYRKFEAANSAGDKARTTALAQKGQMMQSLAGVQAILDKAERYGAKDLAPQEFQSATSDLAGARTDFDGNQLKTGSIKLKQAEEQAGLALSKSIEQYAAKRKAEATVAVNGAEKEIDGIPAGKEEVKTLRDYASAAREALNSATTNYGNQKYEDSIKDSDEAIRLAGIIREQALAAKGKYNVADRNTNITDNKNLGKLPAGWQLYEVQKKKPEDCLSCISQRPQIYGQTRLWTRIYQANKQVIKNPNLIYPGQKLFIPPKTGEIPALNRDEILTPEKQQPAQPQPMENKTETAPQENMK